MPEKIAPVIRTFNLKLPRWTMDVKAWAMEIQRWTMEVFNVIAISHSQ
ncbi:MAG: hypothetical protein J6K05_06480 [Bacteroidaceae bacterium]|nr:hypothetical protein [Bacteroidaceae bacterium]